MLFELTDEHLLVPFLSTHFSLHDCCLVMVVESGKHEGETCSMNEKQL